MTLPDLPELVVVDAAAWRTWLVEHAGASVGVWLVLAKKGVTDPTSLTYDQALEEAICAGWIDGQLARRDDHTFRRRFTPRTATSPWSARNTAAAQRLEAEDRLLPGGLAEVARARADGRWDAAYAGQASMAVPDDLAAALAADPAAAAMFEAISRANRYAVLYRVTQATRADTRARRIAQFVDMLARGETLHPERPKRS
jgi:uncharacterized protein YdeI (YjbR/CyaY-like superfamily)